MLLYKSRILFAVLLPLIFVGGLFSGCAHKAPDTLVLGMELADPPFEMAGTQGKPIGVSVDMANALGKYLGKKVVIENIPFDGLIVALKTGKIDLIISSMTAAAKRAKSIGFSNPYLQTGLCLLVGAKSNIHSIQNLDQPGEVVVVKKGTTGQIYAAQHLRHAKVLVLDKESACVLEVVQGKADAFIYGQMSVLKYWQRNPDTTRALLRPFQAEPWAIGVRKENPELLRQVNAFLKEFRARGGFVQLGDIWLKQQKKTFQDLGIPFYF